MLHDGLVFHFSDEVHRSTLRRGVVDIWIIQGGGDRRGDIYNAGAHIVHEGGGELTRSVKVRVGHRHRGDRIDPGDRVLIQLRSAFVLDRCCRALDGEHIGGLVPVIPEYAGRWPITNEPLVAPCRRPDPRPLAPWTSGNGSPAGNFESWFFVHDEDDQAGGW